MYVLHFVTLYCITSASAFRRVNENQLFVDAGIKTCKVEWKLTQKELSSAISKDADIDKTLNVTAFSYHK